MHSCAWERCAALLPCRHGNSALLSWSNSLSSASFLPTFRFDIGGNNHIRLQYNKCGCVYEIPVSTSRQQGARRSLYMCAGREQPVGAIPACPGRTKDCPLVSQSS